MKNFKKTLTFVLFVRNKLRMIKLEITAIYKVDNENQHIANVILNKKNLNVNISLLHFTILAIMIVINFFEKLVDN